MEVHDHTPRRRQAQASFSTAAGLLLPGPPSTPSSQQRLARLKATSRRRIRRRLPRRHESRSTIKTRTSSPRSPKTWLPASSSPSPPKPTIIVKRHIGTPTKQIALSSSSRSTPNRSARSVQGRREDQTKQEHGRSTRLTRLPRHQTQERKRCNFLMHIPSCLVLGLSPRDEPCISLGILAIRLLHGAPESVMTLLHHVLPPPQNSPPLLKSIKARHEPLQLGDQVQPPRSSRFTSINPGHHRRLGVGAEIGARQRPSGESSSSSTATSLSRHGRRLHQPRHLRAPSPNRFPKLKRHPRHARSATPLPDQIRRLQILSGRALFWPRTRNGGQARVHPRILRPGGPVLIITDNRALWRRQAVRTPEYSQILLRNSLRFTFKQRRSPPVTSFAAVTELLLR